MLFRPISIRDHKKLIIFWKENYFVNELDDFDHLKMFLEKNPGLSLLAEENKKIVGTILGSFDGRRGYIQKLVVDKNYRKKGIGKQLTDKVVKKVHELGALYIPINAEEELIPFYKKCGFKKTQQLPMSISYSTYPNKKS